MPESPLSALMMLCHPYAVVRRVGRFESIRYLARCFRVPALVISPYAKQGFIGHRQTEHSSVPKTIETLFGLPNLTTRDAQANDLLDALDFSQPPRPPQILSTRTCP